MNQGTAKGSAKAITVDSLLKLNNTKSVCKSMTVLDYIAGGIVREEVRILKPIQGENLSVSSALDFLDDIPDLGEKR